MSLREKTIKGAKWSAISTILVIGVGFLQMTLLARFIDAKEFGLLTIATLVIILADTITDFGISNSIIQRKKITELELSTLYWINILIGIIVFVVIFFTSSYIALFLKQQDLKFLIQILAFSFLISPHGQQFRALLQKELEFTKIGLIESISVVLGFVVTMFAASLRPTAASAMFGYLFTVITRTILFSYHGRKKYQPKFIFDIYSVRQNLRFGAYLTLDNIVNQINSNIATAILSRTLGAVITGGYNLAFNVAVMPPTKLNPIITRVLFPAFSKIQDDHDRLRVNFYKLLSLVGFLNFPLLLGLMVVSRNFVWVVFGEKWLFIVPLLQILCVVGLLRSIGNPIGSLLMAKARVDISFKFNLFKMCLFIPSIYIGAILYGSIGAATGFLIIQVLNTILSYFILIKPILGSSYKEYLESIWLPFVLTLPTGVTAFITGIVASLYFKVVTVLALQITISALVFALTIFFSKHAFVSELKQHFLMHPFFKRILREKE